MFRRILVPLDGSERAERALPVAARLARASGGSITLLRVVASPLEFARQAPELPVLTHEALDADQARAANYLARITAVDVLAGVTTTTQVFKGVPAQIILSVARSQQVDIIIMCSHGYTGMTRRLLGSVAEKLAFHAPIPVLVLREGGPVPAGPHPDARRPLRALVALDGSARAEEAIDPAARLIATLATPAQGALHLTQVVEPTTANSGKRDLDESMLHKAKGYLNSIADRFREDSVGRESLPDSPAYPADRAPAVVNLKLPVSWSVALDVDVASALIRVAENGEDAEGTGVFGGCDIIAMATHGFGGVQRWAIGSVTQRVLKATRLPLLIVRPLDIMEKSNFTWDMAILAAI